MNEHSVNEHSVNESHGVDWRSTGFWLPDDTVDGKALAARGATLFDGTFTWPAMILRRSALDHNIATMAAYAAHHQVQLAPHGKTSMVPSLFAAQLEAGAWGITVATANQLLAARRFGVTRVLVANEILDRTPLTWLAGELDRDRDFEAYFYVDSPQGIAVAAEAHAAAGATRPFSVLVELGYEGGRTGVRSIEGAVALAQEAQHTPSLRVAGVAAYEGGLSSVEDARAYLGSLHDCAVQVAGALGLETAIVTAGGSAYFDAVVDALTGGWPDGFTPTVVLRSGAYVTHDDGVYARKTPFNRLVDDGRLRPALEVWGQVTSAPEPGLVLVGLGKREAPYDEGLAIPRRLRRAATGELESADGIVVSRTNDHHAYLDVPDGVEPLVPGDLVGFGISHPCTAFDKWRTIAVLDDEDAVVDVVNTYF